MFLALFIALSLPSNSLAEGLKITASLDAISAYSLSDGDDQGFDLNIRSAEMMLYGSVDHYFDGVLNFAGHTENGEFVLELHEGYISVNRLLPYSNLKVGKFFLGVGRLNQFHQHEWPFIDAPKAHKVFFSDEAVADTGIEYTLIAPMDHYLSLTLGVTRNYCYGHCHQDIAKPPRPLMYGHLKTFFSQSTQKGLQLGLSFINRKNSEDIQTNLVGIDATYKNRQGKRLKWLLQSEVYFQHQDNIPSSVKKTEHIGGYSHIQYGFNPSHMLGLRFDGFSQIDREFETVAQHRGQFDYGFTPTYTWKPSEFSSLRFAYQVNINTLEGEADEVIQLAQLQFNYILGDHPAHEF